MCGIVGLAGNGRAAPAVFDALRLLEYRGYDSAGIATIIDGRVSVRKGVGRLADVQRRKHPEEMAGSTAIGHVRWATHGGVTVANAHPHLDCAGKVAVVHNGIVENYQELRRELGPAHSFRSETDTEVIPHLIEEFLRSGASLETAVREATRKLRGSYALLAIWAGEPDKIVAARQDSSLIAGLGDGRNVIGSDALSFLDITDRLVFMDDGEMAVVTPGGITFFDGDGNEIVKEVQILDRKLHEAGRQGYDFYMLKEIMEEPEAVRCALEQDPARITGMAKEILRAKQVIMTACGTSRYAALIGRYLFSRMARKFSDVVMASEFHYFSDSVDGNTHVIAVSQSGETADVVQGVKLARQKGATIFSLANVTGSSLTRLSHQVIDLNCGPELSVAATKSFVSQLVIFYLLSFAMIDRLDEGVTSLRSVARLIGEQLINGDNIRQIALRFRRQRDFYCIARGINFALAGEVALKLKEVAGVHAEGLPAGELKHGTLALIRKNTPVVVICPRDHTFEETLANAAEVKARGACVIGVSDQANSIFDEWVRIPKVDDIFYPLVVIAPLQLLAYHLSVVRGIDPDHPRNLAKSVTVK